jgi:predicted dehydrogenase
MLQLRLADGLLTQSFFAMNAVEEDRFEVYGQRGRLSVDRHLSTAVRNSEQTLQGARLKQLRDGLQSLAQGSYVLEKMRAPAFEPSYRTALARFVSAVRSGENVKPDLLDGLYSLAVIVAAEESARTRRAVTCSIE